MMNPTTSRYEIDLKYGIWSHDATAWQEHAAGEVFGVLRHLQPFQTVEICSAPSQEDRHGRVLITKIAHGHYEAHGTFSTEWGDVEFLAQELDLDLSEVQKLDDILIYNANGEPGVSRDFHYIESSFALMLLAVEHVESMLVLQDLEAWERFRQQATDYTNAWSVTHES